MIRRLCLLACALALLAPAAAQAAPPQAAWRLVLTPIPANAAPGQEGRFYAVATNVGGKVTEGTSVLEMTLPGGIAPTGYEAVNRDPSKSAHPTCAITSQTVSCETAEPVHPGFLLVVAVKATIGAAEGDYEASATVSGGGASAAASASAPVAVQGAPLPFQILPGFASPLNEPDGSATTLAGAHPYRQTIDFGFPTKNPGAFVTNSGHPRDFTVDLPRGMIGDPTATPVLCTEAQLVLRECPDGSQLGIAGVTTLLAGKLPTVFLSSLYNMVPTLGTPAVLGTDVASVGLFAHVSTGLRSDSDYGIEASLNDILALGGQPIFNIQTQLWGDPSDPTHDAIRGACREVAVVGSCPVEEPGMTPFLTMPGDCSGSPTTTEVSADSWEEPGIFERASTESADLQGNPVTLAGCNQLSYEPTISSQPTTNLADSPSGLEFTLHQPQEKPHLEPLIGRATAELRNARVTLPAGMAANPSQAGGLAACTQAQIGYLGEGHYSKAPQSCPDAAKLGSMEVTSPLLAETEQEGTKIAHDPETGAPLPRPLQGSVYLAKPYENQFGSLLAIYLAVEDPRSGIVAKLAGRVEPDPNTGRLTTVFEENPELPLEDVRLHLFGGARGALITPLACGTHTTTSTLTPWSAPEGLDAHPADSFQTTASPSGGSCPTSEGAAANSPAFQAGTLAPQAGAYSPFVLKLSRGDGSQRIAGIDTLLPPGLTGKLAGIAQCSEAQIAQAKGREAPNQGATEQASPSCPASSEVGTVNVSAGAGPTPFWTSGHAYLAGPYKGAPLSLAAIVPAVAGPFDLGAVVSRVALHVEPESAQIHAVSDPLPQIIEGIPLDVRSVAIEMGRPNFTLNPTSCDPMSITGSVLSSLGNRAALSNPFQVGGCPQLPFKPKLSLKLKGGTKRASHPKLIATLKAKPGEANIAEAQVKLPPSAFLDQAHIRTVCTRVQFAADACPKGSVYGKAQAITPLLDEPLSGNVYLRSSNHKLPDLVVALKGPASLPIEIDLVGKTDSVKGALRNTFEAVPDAPVSSFNLELFGGKRGLVVNSRNLCAHRYRAEVNLTGQNGKVYDTTPAVGTGCKGKGRKRHRARHRHRAGG